MLYGWIKLKADQREKKMLNFSQPLYAVVYGNKLVLRSEEIKVESAVNIKVSSLDEFYQLTEAPSRDTDFTEAKSDFRAKHLISILQANSSEVIDPNALPEEVVVEALKFSTAIPEADHNRINGSLRNLKRVYAPGFFSGGNNRELKLEKFAQLVADAALNADLSVVKALLDGLPSEDVKEILSMSVTTTIDHSGVERTGTALQMAMYGDDYDMASYFKLKMDFEEFKNQCIEVYRQVLLAAGKVDTVKELDCASKSIYQYFEAAVKVQQADAKKLLEEVKKAFIEARDESIMYQYTNSSNSESIQIAKKNCQIAIEDFINDKLPKYLSESQVHNQFILKCVHQLHDGMLGLKSPLYHLLSQKILGSAHKVLPGLWLQYYANGISDLCYGTRTPRRSFICCNPSNKDLDIRTVCARLGIDSFLCAKLGLKAADSVSFDPMGELRTKYYNYLCEKVTESIKGLWSDVPYLGQAQHSV